MVDGFGLNLDYDRLAVTGFELDLQGWAVHDPIFNYVLRHF